MDLVVRSVGYRGEPMPEVPFDSGNNVIPNVDGRVMDGDTALAGVYVAGWIKRGPTGIIGTNKKCAVGTVASVLADREAGLLTPADGSAVSIHLPIGALCRWISRGGGLSMRRKGSTAPHRAGPGDRLLCRGVVSDLGYCHAT